MNCETTPEMEIAVAEFFRPRLNIIVPNTWWASEIRLNHEADLLIITPAGYGYEVEIKVSKSDLYKDQKKDHHHFSAWIRKLFFAIPEKLCHPDCFELIPEDAGILSVTHQGFVCQIRPAKIKNPGAKATPEMRLKLAHLGCMRVVALKRDLITLADRYRKQNQEFRIWREEGRLADYHALTGENE